MMSRWRLAYHHSRLRTCEPLSLVKPIAHARTRLRCVIVKAEPDELLPAFLADFPDDEACTLLDTLRDGGHLVRGVEAGERFAFGTVIDGRLIVGLADNDVDAARALVDSV